MLTQQGIVETANQLLNGRYEIVRVLGSGGMGQTYVAKDTQRPGNPLCVVKQLKTATNDPNFLPAARQMFQNEAEILESLGKQHNQIPQLLASFETEQEFYLVQEFIDGNPLSTEFSLGERWTELQVVQLLQEILSILEFVHGQNVIHRDIKPDNIVRRNNGELVLIDFGAVKQIRTQQTVVGQRSITVSIGTPGYMPTEQASGKPRFSSDLYALGMVCIQALTGLLPTQLLEDKDGELIWRDQAEVSDVLANILTKMVRHYFKYRYESAMEVLQVLQQLDSSTQSSTSERKSAELQKESAYSQTQMSEPETQQPTIRIDWKPPSQAEAFVFDEEPEEELPTSPNNFKRNRFLIGMGATLASLTLIVGAIYIQTRSQQEQDLKVVEQSFADNKFDACIEQAKAFPSYHADLYAKAQVQAENCGNAAKQQVTLQEIQKLKADKKYQDAIKEAQSFSDAQSKFYTEVRNLLGESQLALAQQQAKKGSFQSAISTLSQIASDAPAPVQKETQTLKFKWSERIYSLAEELYQKGKNKADFDKALQMLKAVPQGSPAYDRAQTTSKQWETVEAKNWNDFESAKQALSAGRFKEARDAASRLMGSPAQAWQNQGQSLLTQADEAERKYLTPIDVEGKLALGEPNVNTRADRNTLFRDYEFNGTSGEAITISLRGEGGFDTVLYLIPPDGQEEKIEFSDDISDSNLSSSITTTLNRTGKYRVRVNAYYPATNSQGRGSYHLTVYREGK
ncbi:MAG: protein kinase [Timaviella obliquedivisa GSE-PSE-MK23-08B]|jgi:serine/threonine-protein kinase|nr:protein kinase [Timaviella obliquedivisa GSE-PSE-MK23-08B]